MIYGEIDMQTLADDPSLARTIPRWKLSEDSRACVDGFGSDPAVRICFAI
jgi:hypothetical protein